MRSLLSRLTAAFQRPPSISDDDWTRAVRRAPVVRRLSADQQARLRELAEYFLRTKAITPAAGLQLHPDRRLVLAILCCLPVLQLGRDWLSGWREVIVYPGQFRVRRHDYDEDSGVFEEWDDDLAGESWDRGPLVLSWADVRADLRQPAAGYNVVAHEIAHKLDMLDGTLDGAPPLPDAAARSAWIDAFQPAYDALCADLEAGREPPIDAYAGEAPDEFFAVATEYHYSAPELLEAAYPAVAEQLRRFYGPSPFAAV
jgi:Mlc titration factor MtfA (ptsG expression regulator)